ncbi:MAG: MFS transporter [Myxococcota bacterium]|nr:MFS transporter [Myxococcota bacterium]
MQANATEVTTARGVGVTILATSLGFLNYFDRVVISYAIEPIQHDFGIDNASFGLAMSLFALGTIVVNGISGVLLDRIGVRLVWIVGLVTWSLAMFLLGWAQLWWLFLVFRVLLGLGEGVNFPAMNRAVRDWVPQKLAARTVAIALIGVPGALLLGGPLFSHLIEAVGWRWTFEILGLGGVIMFAVCFFFYRNPAQPEKEAKLTRSEYLKLLRNPTLLATAWSFFAFGAILFFGLTWIPGYFEQRWHEDLQTIGFFSIAPWAVAIVGMLLIGTLSDRIFIRTRSVRKARVHLIWVFQFLAAISFLPLLLVESQVWAVIWLSIGIGLSMSPNGPYYSICSDLFPKQTGAATGIIVTFFSASGVVVPWLVGWLTDTFGGFDVAFIVLSVIVTSGALGMLFFARGETESSQAL